MSMSPARTLRACRSLFKIKVAEGLQYRAAALANASIGVFWGLIEITVYSIFINHGNILNTAALNLPQMISYIWIGQIMVSLTQTDILGDIRSKIINGDVAYELCRPFDLYAHWFVKTVSERLGIALWRTAIILVAGTVMPASYRFSPPASPLGLVLCFLTILGAFCLCGAFSMLLTAVRLGVSWGEGPTYMLSMLPLVLGGGYLPLPFWPDALQGFLLLQPFGGFIDLPARLYAGSLMPDDAWMRIGLQAIWTLAFITSGRLLLKRRLSKLIVQGG